MSSERRVRKGWFVGGYSSPEWRRKLLSVDPVKFMRGYEHARLKSLPDEFVVYRGYQLPAHKNGISWTLDRSVAQVFSNMNSQLPIGEVLERKVKKCEVFAFLDNEAEVLILEGDLREEGLT